MLWVGNFRYSVAGCKESPNVISTSPPIFFEEQNWFHSSSVSWIPQNTSLAHRASIKNRIPYSSIAKSTSPGLSNTTFFAPFHRLLQHIFTCVLFWIPRVNLSLKNKLPYHTISFSWNKRLLEPKFLCDEYSVNPYNFFCKGNNTLSEMKTHFPVIRFTGNGA